MTTIRRAGPEDAASCAEIVRDAREQFDEGVAEEVTAAVRNGDPTWVALHGDAVIGFALVRRGMEATAEIRYLAVRPSRRRRGVGRALVERVADDLRVEPVSYLLVHTLDESVDYPPYDGTRAFWRRQGFVRVAIIDPFPGWQPGNPAALFVLAVGATGLANE